MAPKKKPKKLSLGPAPLASFDTELESEADQQSNSDEGSPSSEESKSQTGCIKQESDDLPNDQLGDDDDTPTPTNQDFEGIMDFPSEEKDNELSLQIESLPQTPNQEVETPTLSDYTSKINEECKKEIEVPKQEEITRESTINKLEEESPMQDVGTKPKIPVRTAPKIPPVQKVELEIKKSDMIDQVDSINKEKIELVDRIEKVILKESEIDKNGTFEKSNINIEDQPKSPLAQVKKKMLWVSSPPKFGAIPKISLTKSLKKEEKAENYGKQSQKIDEGKKLKKDDKKKEKHEEKQKLEKLKEEKRIEEKRKEELRKAKMKEEKKKKEEKRKAEEKRREEKRKEDKKQQELKLEQKKKAKKKKELTEIVKKREKIEEVIEEFKKVTKESIKRKEKLAEREKVEIIEEINIPASVVNEEVEIAGEKVDEVISNVNGAEQEKIVTVAVIETGLKHKVDVVADEKETKESESSDDERELTESEIETEPVQHDIPKIEDSEHAEIADKLITQESVDYDDEQFPMLENIPVTPTLSISTPRKRFDVVTIPIQRPRASTPIQIASLEDYITIASGVEKSYEMEKIKILLPEEEFIAKPTKSPKRTSSKSWFDFCEGGLQSPRILRSPQLSDSSSPTIGSPAKLPLSPRSEVKPSKAWVMFNENEKVSPVEPDSEARISDEEVEVFMEDGNISADIESMTEDDSKKEQIICRIKLKTRRHSEDHSSEEETTSKKESDGSSSDSDETIHNSEESLGESDSTLEDGWQAFERTRAVKVGVKKGDHLSNEMLLPNRGRLGSTGVTDGETDLEPVWVDSPDFFTQNGEAIISEEHIPSPEEILDEKEVNQPLKRQDTKGKILMKQSRALDIEDKFLTESIMQKSTVELEKELIVIEEKVIKDELLGPIITDEHIFEAEIHSISEVSKDEISKEVEIRIEELNVTELPSPAYDFLNIELHIVESSENLAEINKIENEEKFTEEVDDEIPPVKAEIPSAASYPQLPIDLVSSETNVLSKAYTSIDRVNELDSGLYSWTRTTAVSAAEVDSEIDLKSEENKRTYSLSELAALTEEAKIEDKDEDEHEESVDETVFSSEPSYISFSLDQHPLEVVDKQHPIAGLFIEEVDYSYPVDDSIPQAIKTYGVSQDYSQYQPNEEELCYEHRQDLQYSYQEQEVVHGQPTRWDDVEEDIMPERISKVKFEEPTLTTISYLPSSDETHIEDVAEQIELEDVYQKIEAVANSTLSSFIYSMPYVYSLETRPPPPEESPPPPPEESPSPPPDEIFSPSVLSQESQLRPIRKAPPPPPRKTFEYDSLHAQNYYDSSKYDYAPSDVYYPTDGCGDAPPPLSTVGSLQLAAPYGQLTASFLNLFDPAASTLDFSKSQTNGLELDSEFPAIEIPDVNGQNLFEEVFLPMKLPTAAPVSGLSDQSQQLVSDIFETLQEIQGELPAAPAPPAAKFDDWPTGTFTRRDSGIRFPRKQVRTESQTDIDDFIGGQTEAVSQTKVVHDDLLSLEEHQAKEVSKSYDYQEESTFHEGKPKNVFKALADIKPWKKKKKKFHPKPVNLGCFLYALLIMY